MTFITLIDLLSHLPIQHRPIKSAADSSWLYCIGFGAVRSLIDIIFRVRIPESPRYSTNVTHNDHDVVADQAASMKVISMQAISAEGVAVKRLGRLPRES